MTDPPYQPAADELVGNNAAYARERHDAGLQAPPTRRLAVVACMDARMDVLAILGLRNGEAHIIRNGGGVITDDVIRSLCLSQRLLGSREIVLLHHTECGLQKVTEDAFRAELGADLGVTPAWALESFADPFEDVRQSIRRLELSPFVPHTEHLRGFVFDVGTGRLIEVDDGPDQVGARGIDGATGAG